jgi:predicted RNase H-like HicB family nuclease
MNMANDGRKVTYRVMVSQSNGVYKYRAEVPGLTSCFVDGKSRKEVIQKITELIRERIDPIRAPRSIKKAELVEVTIG